MLKQQLWMKVGGKKKPVKAPLKGKGAKRAAPVKVDRESWGCGFQNTINFPNGGLYVWNDVSRIMTEAKGYEMPTRFVKGIMDFLGGGDELLEAEVEAWEGKEEA